MIKYQLATFSYNKPTNLEWSDGMMKPKQKKRGLLLILAAAAMILSACGAAAEAEPTTDPNMVFTQVAETVMVSMTQTSQAMPPTATPEPTATPAPTQPPVPTVDLTQATQSAVPTVALGPTATVQIYGDGAQWKNQSPMDGKVFSEGEEFTFHVCWINIGSTDWDETFYLKFADGNNLWSNTKTFYVGDIVEPGDTWCFDLPSVAPWSAGSYITRWYLYDGDGNFINEVYFSYKVE